jgi:CBS domain-containing protein
LHDETTLVDVAMIRDVLTVGPAHTLRQVAASMATRKVGAAVVSDSDGAGIGIITERDILTSVGEGEDPDVEVTADHRTTSVVFATTTWTITQAAEAMLRGGFRHLIVLEGHDVVGMLSVRDIVRVWAAED